MKHSRSKRVLQLPSVLGSTWSPRRTRLQRWRKGMRYVRPWRRAGNKLHCMDPKRNKALAPEVLSGSSFVWNAKKSRPLLKLGRYVAQAPDPKTQPLSKVLDTFHMFIHFQHGKRMKLVGQSSPPSRTIDGRLVHKE